MALRRRRKNVGHVTWNKDDMFLVLRAGGVGVERAFSLIEKYEQHRLKGKDKPCQAQIMHGPGHQSTSFCVVTGRHKEHVWTNSRGEEFTWTGKEIGSTGAEW